MVIIIMNVVLSFLSQQDAADVSNWGVVGALALPHLLYAFIWYFPDMWMRMFRKSSVRVFESMAWLLKVVQFSSVIAWMYIRMPSGVDVFAIPPLHAVLGVGLVAFGQVLNAGIYQAIGHTGVYYGFKLGHTVPWVDGFPFNVVQHPQYVGSVASVWGMAVLVWSQGPQPDLVWLVVYWTFLYICTGVMESST
mmetsp:Transcript_4853/g.9659  ORF Transcript_4853/g.9659 Transcript_4853/m.9659 type:complete len:193 (+) Transcript_4853:51-629(+)